MKSKKESVLQTNSYIFIFPAEVMSPMVPMKNDFSMSISEYQWRVNTAS